MAAPVTQMSPVTLHSGKDLFTQLDGEEPRPLDEAGDASAAAGGDPLLQDTASGDAPRGIGFNTTSFENQTEKKFAKSAPVWRIVSPGLNVEATCSNTKCAQKVGRVWIRLGHGKHEMSSILWTGKCTVPGCNSSIRAVENVAFWMCKYSVDAKKIEPKREHLQFSGQADRKDHFLTFSNEQAKYISVTIETKPL